MVLLRISPSPNDVDLLLVPLFSILANGITQYLKKVINQYLVPLRIVIDCYAISDL